MPNQPIQPKSPEMIIEDYERNIVRTCDDGCSGFEGNQEDFNNWLRESMASLLYWAAEETEKSRHESSGAYFTLKALAERLASDIQNKK